MSYLTYCVTPMSSCEGRLTVAQRFIAGIDAMHQCSPVGTAEPEKVFSRPYGTAVIWLMFSQR